MRSVLCCLSLSALFYATYHYFPEVAPEHRENLRVALMCLTGGGALAMVPWALRNSTQVLKISCIAFMAYGVTFGTTWTSWLLAIGLFAAAYSLTSKKSKKSKKWEWKHDDRKAKSRTIVCTIDDEAENAVPVNKVGNMVKQILKKARPETDTIALRITSPGGTAESFGLASEHIRCLVDRGFEVVACVDTMAASGGYLIACVAKRVIAAPWAIVGSVGVIGQVLNFSRLLDFLKVDVVKLISGKFKNPIDQYSAINDESRQHMQEKVERIGVQFRQAVLKSRPGANAEKLETADTFSGAEAKSYGLVDDVMTSDQYLRERATTSRIVKLRYKRKSGNGIAAALL